MWQILKKVNKNVRFSYLFFKLFNFYRGDLISHNLLGPIQLLTTKTKFKIKKKKPPTIIL